MLNVQEPFFTRVIFGSNHEPDHIVSVAIGIVTQRVLHSRREQRLQSLNPLKEENF